RPLLFELRVQELLETPLSLGIDSVDRPYSPARDSLLIDRGDETVAGEAAHGVIERPHVNIGIALDHRVREAPLDLVRMEIAPVEHSQDEQLGFHIELCF